MSFLDLPITVQNQIYAYILVPELNPDSKIYKETSIDILFTNRQIHEESGNVFYSKNHFVVVKTIDISLVTQIPNESISIFARNPASIRNCTRIAMTIELYMFDNRLPANSTPSFVVTAAALPHQIRELWMPKLYIWSMQCSLSIQKLYPFSYSHAQLEKELLQPLTGCFLSPTFVGISTLDPSISAIHVEKLHQRFIGTYEPRSIIAKLHSLQPRVLDASPLLV